MFVVYRVVLQDDGKKGVEFERMEEFPTLDEANEFMQKQRQEHASDSYTIMME